MQIKHLQCNTYLLNNPQAVADYIVNQNIDVACLQEVVIKEDEADRLKAYVEEHGYEYRYGMHLFNEVNRLSEGVAIVSKYPIIESYIIYHNGENENPKSIGSEDVFGKQLVGYDPQNFHPASRAMTYKVLPTAILAATIAFEDSRYLRIINTHFPVSDFCSEIPPMYDIAAKVTSLVKYGNNIPTIFSGDLNIRAKSYSVELLQTVMTCHSTEFDDTLASHHKAKIRGNVEKLAIDHIFSTGLEYKGTKVDEVDFSDHKMLISEFVC